MSSYWVRNLTRRVRVHGTITYIDPGQSLVLEDGQRSLWRVNTESLLPLHVGDEIDAFGFSHRQRWAASAHPRRTAPLRTPDSRYAPSPGLARAGLWPTLLRSGFH